MNKYLVTIKNGNSETKSFPVNADNYQVNGFLLEFYDGEEVKIAYHESRVQQIRLVNDEE